MPRSDITLIWRASAVDRRHLRTHGLGGRERRNAIHSRRSSGVGDDDARKHGDRNDPGFKARLEDRKPEKGAVTVNYKDREPLPERQSDAGPEQSDNRHELEVVQGNWEV